MLKIIGIILLVYGVAGVVGTVLAYAAWRGPMQRLRVLLQHLARTVALGGEASRRASSWVNLATPIFDHLAGLIAKITSALRQAASRFGEAASIIKSVESTLDSVQFPVLTPQTETLNLSFSVDAVSGVNLTEYEVSGFKVYGPPLTLDKTPVAFDLGELPVLTGVAIAPIYPLVPVGDVFRFTGEKIEAAQQRMDEVADFTAEVKDGTLAAKEKVEKTSESIRDLGDRLDEASRDLAELSQSRILSLLPALALGCFGFIHLAFALTGLALLNL